MACLKIQVFGKGLIPRGYGLAPRKNPFPADYVLIGTILNTPGLSVKYINPETGVPADLTKSNLKKIWDKYSNYVAPVKPVVVEESASTPDNEVKGDDPVTPPPVSAPVNSVPSEPDKVEEPVKDNSDTIKPVVQEYEVKSDKVEVPGSEDLKPITSDQDSAVDKTQNNTNSNNNQKYNNSKNNNNNNNSKNNNNNKNNH